MLPPSDTAAVTAPAPGPAPGSGHGSRVAQTPPAPRLLLIDPDHPRRQRLARLLRDHGHEVQASADTTDLPHLARLGIELVLVNTAAPATGTRPRPGEATACAPWAWMHGQLGQPDHRPVIVLHPGADCTERTVALELGADAVVDDPDNLPELLARMRSLLRRHRAPDREPDQHAACPGWRLDPVARRVQPPHRPWIQLSPTEYRLMAAFMRHPGRVLDRNTLLDLALGRHGAQLDRSIDLLVSRLRRRLGDRHGAGEPLLHTLRGAGYCFRPSAAPPFMSNAQHDRHAALTAHDDDGNTGQSLGMPRVRRPAQLPVGPQPAG